MNIATIAVSSVYANVEDHISVPSGIVGASVTFRFTDSRWDGLQKTAVFKGTVTRDVIMDGNRIEIPHETVAQEGKRLKVGVYGVDADNNLVIPTLWANLGMIRAAAEPSGDPGTDPQLPVWAQIQSEVDALKASGMGGGIAVSGAAVGQTVKISAVDEHGVPTAWEPADFLECGGKTDYCIQEGEPSADDMPKVFFGAALPQSKDDTIMSFRYISKTRDISGWCKTKAQGDNSMSNPKKNQTVKLYKDAACTEKLKVNFKGWGEQNKFCFKANWEDLTHARNFVCARLWGEVVKSRPNYAAIPERLRTSPNQGAVDGFPVKLYANGIYQGRYTLNIPKDPWMTNMDEDVDTHCILCGEGDEAGSSQFKALAKVDGTDWTDEIHDTVPDAIKTRWNQVISFVMTSTDQEFKANLGSYFGVQSLLDYYLFGVTICHTDGFKKNQLYFTYDGEKWYASAYDMDKGFGMPHRTADLEPSDAMWFMGDWNLLYHRLDTLFIEELKQRWQELGNTVLSVENIINAFERFTDICSPWLVEEDYAQTTANGSFAAMSRISTIQQIRDFAKKRHDFVNAYLDGHDVGGLLLYHLSETTLDGTKAIDTGIDLNSMDAYTVLIDYTLTNNDTQSMILDNHRNSIGWNIQYSTGLKYGALGAGATAVKEAIHPWGTQDLTGIRVKVMVRKSADGQYHFRSSDMESPGFRNFTSSFGDGNPGQNLWIGGNYYEQGVVNALANAKIHDCKVYNNALTNDMVMEYLNT